MVDHSRSIIDSLHNNLNTNGYGLEVSPYYQPVLKKTCHSVLYTDYMDNESIQKKALDNPELNKNDIPLIDFVWNPDKSIADCMTNNKKFDYVVASHVMEHVSNPLGWITELLSVISVGGRIGLFLPDRRFTSDYFRKETCFAQLLEWWIEQPNSPTIGQVVDFMLNTRSLNHSNSISWKDESQILSLRQHYSFEEVISTGTAIFNDRPYVDVHCTVWTSKSFESTFKKVEESGIIGAKLVCIIEDEGEFLAILEKSSEPLYCPPKRKEVIRDTDTKRDRLLESIDHQLGILRHDLTHLIEKSHESAGTNDRIESSINQIKNLKYQL